MRKKRATADVFKYNLKSLGGILESNESNLIARKAWCKARNNVQTAR